MERPSGLVIKGAKLGPLKWVLRPTHTLGHEPGAAASMQRQWKLNNFSELAF
jgi:hypothetical protein